MEMESGVPPGFRFHPTEEELVGYYLKRKITSLKIDLDVITDIDLYNMEPWDIEDKCKLGYEEQNEWYFFSHKDRKYPTGTRTNRATVAGFWKATGRDKAVLSKERIIGMRKTLVYYKGRAPNGRKSDWIMHEYRLQTSEHGPPQEEGWVVCRVFKKPNPSHKQNYQAWNNGYYVRDNKTTYRPPSYPSTSNTMQNDYDPLNQETNNFYQLPFPTELPKLDSPSISTSFTTNDNSFEHNLLAVEGPENDKSNFADQYNDWKSFDKLLGSQVFEPDLSYGYTTNMPLDPHNDELSNVLEYFHDL